MPREMVRILLFGGLVLGLCVWAVQYRGQPRPRRVAEPTAKAVAPVQVSEREPHGAVTAGTSGAPKKRQPGKDAGLPDDAMSPGMPGLTVAQARKRRAIIEGAREHARKNAERYAAYSAAFEREPKDPQWAPAREKHLIDLMAKTGVDHMLVGVECRSTMCRMEWEIVDSHSAIMLTQAPGLMDALGGERSANSRSESGTYVVLSPPGER